MSRPWLPIRAGGAGVNVTGTNEGGNKRARLTADPVMTNS